MCTHAHHGNDSTHKLEEGEMLRVDSRRRIDLQSVAVLASILEQTVHRVQHLVREVEEPFPRRATIVETFLPSKHDVEASTKILRLEAHNLTERKRKGW